MCNINPTAVFDSKSWDPKACLNINIIPQQSFYPYGWFECNALYHHLKTNDEWAEIFKDSLGVHMYFGSEKSKVKIKQAKYYGIAKPAYAMLGPKNCPLSFESVKIF